MRFSRRDLGVAVAASTFASFLSQPGAARTQWISVGTTKSMRAYLVTPDGPGPFPAVLVLHTSGGLKGSDTAFAERLAHEGYVTLTPAFLEAYRIASSERQLSFTTYAQRIYDDFVSALETLRHTAGVDGGKLGAVGFSNGGYFTAWLAATGKIQAGVAYYGAFNGAQTDKALTRFSNIFSKSSAPLLILQGTDDFGHTGAAHHLAGIIRSAGGAVEAHFFPGAHHEFERAPQSDEDRAAGEQAWPLTLAFLKRYLGSTS